MSVQTPPAPAAELPPLATTSTPLVPEPQTAGPGILRVALRGAARSAITFVGVVAVLAVLWVGFLELLDVDPYVGKTPGEVWRWFSDPAMGAERRSELLNATWSTLIEAGAGFVTGLLAAVAVAIAFTLSRPVERTLMPIALALRSVPIVAMVPLFAYVFGRGVLGSLVIISIIVAFPALVLVANGLRSARPESLELLVVYDASPITRLIKVQLPTALPSLLASAKVCAPLAVLGAILNGWLSTGKGLGSLMVLSTVTAEYTKLWAAVVIVTVSSVLFAAIVSAAEQVVLARYAPDRLC